MKKINLALVATALVPALSYAQETPAATNSSVGMIALAAGLCMGSAASLIGLGQSRAAAAALEGIARNPGSANKVFVPLLLSLALMEALALFAFLAAGNILKLNG